MEMPPIRSRGACANSAEGETSLFGLAKEFILHNNSIMSNWSSPSIFVRYPRDVGKASEN
ncbi:hypothetical protein ZHAS_00014385 [Anopheles sinensis]|uniref:Uncharacterized protein n=1 Tax=Anopheles sinensis TaxID=74873 RepID=A0A084W845_ANOSI|nr:hypothetical protein ZHAS_00014385 [Anopheles sinensis]